MNSSEVSDIDYSGIAEMYQDDLQQFADEFNELSSHPNSTTEIIKQLIWKYSHLIKDKSLSALSAMIRYESPLVRLQRRTFTPEQQAVVNLSVYALATAWVIKILLSINIQSKTLDYK